MRRQRRDDTLGTDAIYSMARRGLAIATTLHVLAEALPALEAIAAVDAATRQ